MTTNAPSSNSAMPTTRGLNFFGADPNLAFSLKRHAGEGEAARATPLLQEMGAIAGGELDMLAMLADHNPPTLRSFDERGQRIDEVVYHPAFIEMQRIGFSQFGFAAMSHRDGVLGWLIYVPLAVYTAIAGRRFYGFNWWQNILFLTAFYFAHTFIVYSLYKFLLFVTVINQIH